MAKLLPLILLSACSLTSEHDKYLDRIDSVTMGDSYRLVLAKIINKPFVSNCRRPVNSHICNVVYATSDTDKIILTFNVDKKLIGIY